MASVTTNYGFDVPTSSDLVKNGATQIALLGQDLDTFLFRPFTRNGILNGSMNVAQRGTSIAVAASSNPYTLDRWKLSLAAGAAYTVSQQATSDTTNLPFIQSCARVQRNSGQTGVNPSYFIQGIETVNSIPFAGKQVTFSFYARKGSNFSATSDILNYIVAEGTGTDQDPAGGYTGQNNVLSTNATLTTTWQRFTTTATVASTTKEIKAFFSYTPTGTASTNDYYEVTGVQLEVGSQNSPYTPAGSSYQAELAMCQRYYWQPISASGENLSMGFMYSATQLQFTILPIVTMRVTPTVVQVTGTDYWQFNRNGGQDLFNSWTLATASPTAISLYNNTEISGTAGNAGGIASNNAATRLAFSAEL